MQVFCDCVTCCQLLVCFSQVQHVESYQSSCLWARECTLAGCLASLNLCTRGEVRKSRGYTHINITWEQQFWEHLLTSIYISTTEQQEMTHALTCQGVICGSRSCNLLSFCTVFLFFIGWRFSMLGWIGFKVLSNVKLLVLLFFFFSKGKTSVSLCLAPDWDLLIKSGRVFFSYFYLWHIIITISCLKLHNLFHFSHRYGLA